MNEAELRSTFHATWIFLCKKIQINELTQSINMTSKKIVILDR